MDEIFKLPQSSMLMQPEVRLPRWTKETKPPTSLLLTRALKHWIRAQQCVCVCLFLCLGRVWIFCPSTVSSFSSHIHSCIQPNSQAGNIRIRCDQATSTLVTSTVIMSPSFSSSSIVLPRRSGHFQSQKWWEHPRITWVWHHTPQHHGLIWRVPEMGVPQNGWFLGENPLNGWFRVTPHSRKPPYTCYINQGTHHAKQNSSISLHSNVALSFTRQC